MGGYGSLCEKRFECSVRVEKCYKNTSPFISLVTKVSLGSNIGQNLLFRNVRNNTSLRFSNADWFSCFCFHFYQPNLTQLQLWSLRALPKHTGNWKAHFFSKDSPPISATKAKNIYKRLKYKKMLLLTDSAWQQKGNNWASHTSSL